MDRDAAESKRIFEVFRRFTPVVQGLSLDEAFLDVTGTERLHGPPRAIGEALRAAVREEIGLAVSVGIAPVKMVAKIASDAAKPDGLLEVAPGGVADFLEPLPVRRLWGVGPVAEQRLRRFGFETVGDLARHDPEALRRRLGDWGADIGRLARGCELSEVEPYREPVTHAESVARRLRRGGWLARTVVLKLKLARRVAAGPRGYPMLTRRATLERPTDDGAVLSAEACRLLARAGLEQPVRLLGVGVTNLVAHARDQLDLFDAPAAKQKRSRLNRALDELADRFGNTAVVRGDPSHASRSGLSFQLKHGERRDPDPDPDRD
jgi:DNA polymerase-4